MSLICNAKPGDLPLRVGIASGTARSETPARQQPDGLFARRVPIIGNWLFSIGKARRWPE